MSLTVKCFEIPFLGWKSEKVHSLENRISLMQKYFMRSVPLMEVSCTFIMFLVSFP